MFPSCFDASSCALAAHLVEHSATTCVRLCPSHRPLHRVLPRVMGRWLHRNSQRALEMVEDDVADTALDAINAFEPHLAAAVLVCVCCMAWLSHFRYSARQNRRIYTHHE